jgi:hypothetical protein
MNLSVKQYRHGQLLIACFGIAPVMGRSPCQFRSVFYGGAAPELAAFVRG